MLGLILFWALVGSILGLFVLTLAAVIAGGLSGSLPGELRVIEKELKTKKRRTKVGGWPGLYERLKASPQIPAAVIGQFKPQYEVRELTEEELTELTEQKAKLEGLLLKLQRWDVRLGKAYNPALIAVAAVAIIAAIIGSVVAV